MPGKSRKAYEQDDELMDEGAGGEEVAGDEVDRIDAEASQEVKDTIGAAAPEPTEPLAVQHVNRLADAIVTAVEALSDGEITPAPVEPASGTQVDMVDPGLWTNIVGLRAFLDAAEQAGIEEATQYDFDPATAVTTTEGITDTLLQVQRIARDAGLKSKVLAGKPEGGETEEEAPVSDEPSDDDVAALM